MLKIKRRYYKLLVCLVPLLLLLLVLSLQDLKQLRQILFSFHPQKEFSNKSLKYILLWTDSVRAPFVYMQEGQKVFLQNKCPYTNCYVTSNKSLLGDYTKFDVIAFNGPDIVQGFTPLPKKRSPHQKYVFASIESSYNYPLCDKRFDLFFNWTWTYKLNSDARWGYLVVRDIDNKIIGPKEIMHWKKIEVMDLLSSTVRKKIMYKSKTAAWFVTNCITMNKREMFIGLLQQELATYGLSVDIYGGCSPRKCPRNDINECLKLIEKDYYFYLAYENAESEDYVTDELLHALNHYAVPVVFGGANYTRFMPDDIYLNAKELGPGRLAEIMNDLVNDPEAYEQYFRWHNHYKYHRRVDSVETDEYCTFCSMLNDEELVQQTTIYGDFKSWWTPPGRC